jgi:hypothetical protein
MSIDATRETISRIERELKVVKWEMALDAHERAVREHEGERLSYLAVFQMALKKVSQEFPTLTKEELNAKVENKFGLSPAKIEKMISETRAAHEIKRTLRQLTERAITEN